MLSPTKEFSAFYFTFLVIDMFNVVKFLFCSVFVRIKVVTRSCIVILVIIKLDVKIIKYLYFFRIFYFLISGSNVGSHLVFAIGSAMCDLTDSNFRFRTAMSWVLGQIPGFLLPIYQVPTSQPNWCSKELPGRLLMVILHKLDIMLVAHSWSFFASAHHVSYRLVIYGGGWRPKNFWNCYNAAIPVLLPLLETYEI